MRRAELYIVVRGALHGENKKGILLRSSSTLFFTYSFIAFLYQIGLLLLMNLI